MESVAAYCKISTYFLLYSLFSRTVLIWPQCFTPFLSSLGLQTCRVSMIPFFIQQTRAETTGQKDSAIFLLAFHLCNASRIAVFPEINPRPSGEIGIHLQLTQETSDHIYLVLHCWWNYAQFQEMKQRFKIWETVVLTHECSACLKMIS